MNRHLFWIVMAGFSILTAPIFLSSQEPQPPAAAKTVVLEDFEGYTNDLQLAKTWYRPPHGGGATQTIERIHTSDGRQALKWEYHTTKDEKTHYSAICRVSKWDASGCNAAQFWLKPDGSGRQITFQLNIADARGKNIHEVLDMTVEQAYEFFKPVPVVARKLHTLLDVGLGYIRLGQSATTLSGGEAQRVKLSLELSKRDTGRTLFILDEPTTGLHFHDIDLLLKVLHRLRDHGNTVVVIEHNLDVIKTADWVVDLGPEGGDGGGRIVATGTPEEVARAPGSHTGRYLAPVLGAQASRAASARR